jgi:D-alanyl-D-alanine carboxypeptidase (penicillin-binding protein 5/6)
MAVFYCPNPVAWANELKLDARSAILIDAESGQVLYEQDADAKCYPASVTKIMTLLLALEAVHNGSVAFDDMVIASEYASSFGGTQVWLEPGEKFTLKEILLAIAVGSANDASVALAEHIAGSNEAFVKLMNEKAAAIGAKNTRFANPHGLHDPNHYTTARDMALISKYALKYPEMLELTKIKNYTFRKHPKLVLWNTNKLLWWYPGTEGLKTGTTSEGGRSLASTVDRDGLRLIAVVLGIDKPRGHFSESIKLYNYGFSKFAYKMFFAPGDIVTQVAVANGETDTLAVVPLERVGTIIEKSKGSRHIDFVVEIPTFVTAPVEKGQKIGHIIMRAGEKEITKMDLVAAEDIARGSLWQQILRVFINITSF